MTEDNPLSRSDRTRRAILQAAYSLFISQGYAATSMRQIADASGIALGGLYNHFPSKDSMFEAIIEESHPFLQIVPFLASAEGNTIEEFMKNAAGRLVEELGRRPEFLNLMLIELVEFKGVHAPKVFEKILPTVMTVAEKFHTFQGEVRPISPFILMRAFLGMFFSYFLTDMLLKNVIPVEIQRGALDEFVEIFLNGVKVHNSSPNLQVDNTSQTETL